MCKFPQASVFRRSVLPSPPLVFAILIEPQTAAIRQNKYIAGFQTEHVHPRISLYANDVRLFHRLSMTSGTANKLNGIYKKHNKKNVFVFTQLKLL